MSTPNTQVREALREALSTHDAAAISHMRSATQHLREARSIADRIERLTPKRTTK